MHYYYALLLCIMHYYYCECQWYCAIVCSDLRLYIIMKHLGNESTGGNSLNGTGAIVGGVIGYKNGITLISTFYQVQI